MSAQSTGLGKDEKRVARIKVKHPPELEQDALLYTRQQTARLLSCSIMTVMRLEQRGVLDLVKLSPGPAAKGYNKARQVHALAEQGCNDAA
jgi:hypothetical protein